MDTKLKALKVPELKAVLAAAGVPLPSKAVKTDIIATILASQPALDAYYALHDPENADAHRVADEPPQTTAPVQEPVSTPVVKASQASKPASAAAPKPKSTPTASDDSKPTEASTEPVDPEEEKRRRRAARFGIPVVEPKAPKPTNKQKPAVVTEDEETLKARAARFGIDISKAAPASKRKQGITEEIDDEELARRKRRAERFGLTPKS